MRWWQDTEPDSPVSMLNRVIALIEHISASALGCDFSFRVEVDNEFENGRIFLQATYMAPCTKTGDILEWHGRKWYLSKFMTDDEIVKTAYAAFKAAVEHEVMEGFKVDGIILFNPHINYTELLAISHKEVKRELV
jgi:hypothetical protein